MLTAILAATGLGVVGLVGYTLMQKKSSGLRIYGPLFYGRYAAESIRDKFTQYTERPGDGRPFSLLTRNWVYRASKSSAREHGTWKATGVKSYQGFGTTADLHTPGKHLFQPAPAGFTRDEVRDTAFHVKIGEFLLTYPVTRSGMSFGALGAMATRALSDANGLLYEHPHAGGLDNTGEGGMAPHHCPVTPEGQEYLDKLTERARRLGHSYTFRFDKTATSDGKLIDVPLDLRVATMRQGRAVRPISWGTSGMGLSERDRHLIVQIGPSLSGVRVLPDMHGNQPMEIDWEWLDYICGLSWVRGVEIKLQQGAKPNDGGTVAASKLTDELCALRGIKKGEDYQSPERFPYIPSPAEATAFDQAHALCELLLKVRNLPNFKRRGLILGVKMTYTGDEFLRGLAVFRDSGPDYIQVDGAEGGTGAADTTMTDRVGMDTYNGLSRAHHALVRYGARDRIKIVGSGRLVDAGTVAAALCLGADWVATGRGVMLAMGCIQARDCHSGRCPAGITTHNAWRQRGLDPENKAVRVGSYLRYLRSSVMRIARSVGVDFKNTRFEPRHMNVVMGPGRVVSSDKVYTDVSEDA